MCETFEGASDRGNMLRTREMSNLRAWWSGFREGWRNPVVSAS